MQDFEASEGARHTLEEARALRTVMHAASASLDPAQVLDTIVRYAVELCGADAGAIFEYEPARGSFVGVASFKLSATFFADVLATPVNVDKGVLQRSREFGAPWQIPDVEQATRYIHRRATLREGLRALAAAPIGGEPLRGVVIFRRTPGEFEERVVNLLAALAAQSKVAIDNARLFQEVARQRAERAELTRRLEQLYSLSTAMQEPLSLREQLGRVMETAREVLQLDRIWVWELMEETQSVLGLARAGFPDDEGQELDGVELPLAEFTVLRRAYEQGTTLMVGGEADVPIDLAAQPAVRRYRALRTKHFFVVPMVARGHTIGFLTGDNKPSRRPLTPQMLGLLPPFASHAAVAIANARLFRAIEEKSREVELANRHKSQFLANMSHELRTPLNAILGYTELMLDGVYGDTPGRLREVLERVDRSGRHLLGLINDVLDLSKIEAGELALAIDDYAIGDVVQTVVTAVEPLAVEKGLRLTVDAPARLPRARGDERRIAQVLLNLLGNAVKFTDAGSVALMVRATRDEVAISVRDTGPGIRPQDQTRIFEEFQQVDSSSTRTKGGTGLGLSIARRIVAMHGGDIGVTSRPGAGSTFWVRLPLVVEPARAVAAR